MFKSWSVGKPQILVQVSVEKKPKNNNVIYRKKNDQPVLHIYKWKILYMFI